jgi:hypothetical protein
MTAGTQDAINQDIDFHPFLRTLQPFSRHWQWFARYQVRFNILILFPEGLHINNKVFDNGHVGKGTNRNRIGLEFRNQGIASKAILSVNMHGTRTTNSSPAGRPKGQGIIQSLLDIIKPLEYG